jgi:hypothetical protein
MSGCNRGRTGRPQVPAAGVFGVLFYIGRSVDLFYIGRSVDELTK